MKPTILHIDLDTFFVSCERLLDSRLMKRPLLVGGLGDRGVVAACSYETRRFGVHSGMPMKVARRLCPEATVIKGNAGTYMKFSDNVTEIIKESVPVFEKASVDEFYADLSGMDRFFGCYKYASEIRQRILRETGLPISFGLSQNKVVSKVATGEAKPNNQMKIDLGLEKEFLAPLHIRKLPSVGEKTYGLLSNMGVTTIQTVQQLPLEMLESAFGLHGRTIWMRAQGLDNSPLLPFHERKSISTERTYGKDTTDMVKLETTLFAMAENLAYQLRRANKMTGCVSVKIRYSDFKTYTKQKRVPYTSADHVLVPLVKELFTSLYDRRMLIRLVGVNYSHIVGGHYQIDLFADDEKLLNLYQAMDRVRNRFGESSLMRASAMGAHSIGRGGNPFDGQPPILLAHRQQ
ncbi:DNA polymerase IV [Flagellimonas taeanensis]|jgi:DNA polymerase-4|uniref:DNA polymerase IV n=5 Tax=Flagellimonas TaxID=444459 RepID=A0A4S8RYB2_9FLAO|nr:MULTISPECIES: DNA polymerase IV [Allomuricauda]KAB5487043.1 DNA polymerase IV [Allomuricauda hadalis]MBW8244095.1 DNA polymerase IV [Allomuricauda oceani]QII45066.1 DNA polymerase IV [Allomuricauda oceani]RIV45210.1 DNA polymerase IV [Allomuricauda maritima]RIV51735.1 DNA polymerase IV [Allomuricauda taeanensis]